NVMVGAFGEVQVMDWGLAKQIGARETQSPGVATPGLGGATQAGSILGTPGYMPPEQARGEVDRIDRRSDVFALGAILSAILTGKPAYTGAQALDRARRGDLEAAHARLDACGADA